MLLRRFACGINFTVWTGHNSYTIINFLLWKATKTHFVPTGIRIYLKIFLLPRCVQENACFCWFLWLLHYLISLKGLSQISFLALHSWNFLNSHEKTAVCSYWRLPTLLEFQYCETSKVNQNFVLWNRHLCYLHMVWVSDTFIMRHCLAGHHPLGFIVIYC